MKFEKCKCGSRKFYMRQIITGECDFYIDINGESIDNESMHEGLTYKNARSYYRCVNCDRRAREVVE